MICHVDELQPLLHQAGSNTVIICCTDVLQPLLRCMEHSQRSAAGGTNAQQAAALATPLDILVATPQKLLQHAEKGNVFYGDVQCVVLDEADTMFDRGFGPDVEKVLGPLRSKPEPAQCILVAATLTKVRVLTAASCAALLVCTASQLCDASVSELEQEILLL